MMKAVIDLGTNTFNLLIGKVEGDKLQIIVNKRIPVKLGSGGIHLGQITKEAYQRGIDAISDFYNVLNKHNVEHIMAMGTSALRSTANGPQFIKEIREKFEIEIELISGMEEADFIYRGVKNAIDLNETSLILDIGGGSNEFIIANSKKMFWKYSFDLGIARLLERFHPNDPITLDEINTISNILKKELETLWEAISKYQPKRLIGAAGTFDTYAMMLYPQTYGLNTFHLIKMEAFFDLAEVLIHSTQQEKLKMENLPAFRSEMIVLATLFTSTVLKEGKMKELIHSAYSLKEGVFFS